MIAFMLAMALVQTPMTITTVAQGEMSNVEDVREVVVRTPAEWQTLWRLHGATPPAPAVDFGRQMVVGAFLGSRPTGGFGVAVTAAEVVDGTLVVRYTVTMPGAGMMTAQVLTAPFHLVRLDKVDGAVRFEKTEKRGR